MKDTNCLGLYFENGAAFEKRTYYPVDQDTNFVKKLNWDTPWTDNNPERLFWNRNFMQNPFTTSEFYYAEINHPTMGKAIYGASRNRGYVWQFDSEKDLKTSMNWTFGEMYKDMLKDGYITIKIGHNNITAD